MSISIISDSTPIARKAYKCDSSEYVRDFLNEGIFTFSEYRQIVVAKQQGWKILPGQRYEKQENVYDGIFYTFRAIPEMAALCRKYQLYPEL